MFAQKQPDQLRTRLAHLQREFKLKHVSKDDFNQEAFEILTALKKLEIPLTESEKQFMDSQSNTRNLESAADKLGASVQQNLMTTASAQVASASKAKK